MQEGQLLLKDSNHIFHQLMVAVDGKKVVNAEYIDKSEYSLNEVWWNNLSEDWKDLILYNIDIVPKIEDKHRYLVWQPYQTNYLKIIGKEYVELQNYKVDDVLEKAYLLDKFFLHNNFKALFDLKPLYKLQNLKSLKMSVIYNESDAISKLENLTNLEIWKNFSDLALLIKLKKLKSLSIRDNIAGFSLPEKLITKIKANGGTVEIWSDEKRPF